jgi:hypothetical protein
MSAGFQSNNVSFWNFIVNHSNQPPTLQEKHELLLFLREAEEHFVATNPFPANGNSEAADGSACCIPMILNERALKLQSFKRNSALKFFQILSERRIQRAIVTYCLSLVVKNTFNVDDNNNSIYHQNVSTSQVSAQQLPQQSSPLSISAQLHEAYSNEIRYRLSNLNGPSNYHSNSAKAIGFTVARYVQTIILKFNIILVKLIAKEQLLDKCFTQADYSQVWR